MRRWFFSGCGEAKTVAWLSIAFALGYGQILGISANQNQYYLHGFARAGVGDLASDWLAQTRDPTPVFSAMVAATKANAGTWALHLVYFALLALYFASCYAIASKTPFFPRSGAGRILFSIGMIALHATIIRSLVIRLAGSDHLFLLQSGVAAQYVLGPGLQPSAFGVLLLASLAAFVHGRPLTAAVLVALACTFHSTYLLSGGSLIAGMMIGSVLAGKGRTAIQVGLIALAGVLPVIIYSLATFQPSSPSEFEEAQRLLAFSRLPHHADFAHWMNREAVFQSAWMAAGVIASRGTALFPVLFTAAATGLALGTVQVVTGNPTLALLFPWRASVLLVPTATALSLSWVARYCERAERRTPFTVCAGIVLFISVAGALVAHVKRTRDRTPDQGLTGFVAANRRAGETYLVPAGFTNKAFDGFELDSFRLSTGAAIFADNKSIPYKDAEVLEWRRRVELAARWYGVPDWDGSGAMEEAIREGITHVVVPAAVAVKSEKLVETYRDAAYRVFRIKR
jgi:hypothetical protein